VDPYLHTLAKQKGSLVPGHVPRAAAVVAVAKAETDLQHVKEAFELVHLNSAEFVQFPVYSIMA
jgi:hypothetical protein